MFNKKLNKDINRLHNEKIELLEERLKMIRSIHCIRLNLIDIKYSKSEKCLVDVKAIEIMESAIDEIIKTLDR